MNPALGPTLEAMVATRDSGRDLAADPLVVVRRYASAADREAAAWVAALLAYGRVASILRALDDLLGRMPDGPGAFLAELDVPRDSRRLRGFKHRWTRGADLIEALAATRAEIDAHGSMEAAFLAGDDARSPHLGPALADFSARLLARVPEARRTRSVRWLLAGVGGGSAAKRLCLFLRWVARPDDGLDLGLWKGVDPARLVVPLDTHVFRIGHHLGLTDRRTPGWQAALDITAALSRLDPKDPVRFDFALSHLGILGDCPSSPVPETCGPCPIRSVCRHWAGQPGRLVG